MSEISHSITASLPESIEVVQQQIIHVEPIISRLSKEVAKTIVGQQMMIDRLMIALLGDGHVLLEGNPGLAKTLTIKTLAAALDVNFKRIQFTPDLLPADLIGTMIYHPGKGEFSVRQGPLFANFILADEINRAPAKVQSALLEAMAERQVTIHDTSYKLPSPFLVLATQNPIEQDGTYPLPEAQLDRFMMKLIITYPEWEEERTILRSHISSNQTLQPIKSVVSAKELEELRQLAKKVYLDEKIEKYILNLVFATRTSDRLGLKELKGLISYGASPRATINLAIAAKCEAMLQGRAFVIPEDVKMLAPDILRHRIGLTFEAEAENISIEEIIKKVLNSIVVP